MRSCLTHKTSLTGWEILNLNTTMVSSVHQCSLLRCYAERRLHKTRHLSHDSPVGLTSTRINLKHSSKNVDVYVCVWHISVHPSPSVRSQPLSLTGCLHANIFISIQMHSNCRYINPKHTTLLTFKMSPYKQTTLMTFTFTKMLHLYIYKADLHTKIKTNFTFIF